MKQIVMTGPRKSHVVEVPEPKIDDGQLLVRITYAGLCHSELYPWSTAKPGDILGHETVGVVVEAGKNTEGFKPGDRVTGLGAGGFKEYCAVLPCKTFHVPDNVKDEDAIVEPLACQLSGAIRMMPEKPGDSIAVVGCGYMGLGMISLFKLCGYGQIVAVDKRPEALENARRFGATECYRPEELPPEYVLNWENIGRPDLTRKDRNERLFCMGFENVMEYTGAEDGLRLAGDMVRAHGRLGIGGYHNDAFRTIDYRLWNFKAFTSINCHERRVMYEASLCQRCLDMLGSGQWGYTGVTKHIYAPEELDRGFEDMDAHRDNFIKGAVRF